VCHLKDRITGFLSRRDFGLEVVLSDEQHILGTGGGIGRMRASIQADDFVVHNGDIVTDIKFSDALAFHKRKRALATLIVEKRKGTRDVLVDTGGHLADIAERLDRDGSWFGFTGITILNRAIFDHLPENGFADMIDIHASLIQKGEPIYGFESTGHYWLDIGTREKYLRVHRDILGGKALFPGVHPLPRSSIYIGDGSHVHEHAELSGFVSIGRNCSIGEGVRLKDCVVFDNTQLKDKRSYADRVLAPEFVV
jgi:mannose-1-phosphate guanylyltransferase/phosphomannomutase